MKSLAFDFENHQVRSVIIDNEPWFVAHDVCKALKLTDTNKTVNKLDDDEKGTTSIRTLGGNQEMLIINESGLFTLILRCRDAVNKGTIPYRFRKWVTSEVLPSIRKTGKYEIDQGNLINSPSYRHESHLAVNAFYDACKAELDKAGVKVPNLPKPDNKVLDGLISGMLVTSRFLLSFDHNLKVQISQVPANSCIVNTKDKSNMSTIMQEFVPIELIPELMKIGLQRLARQIK